MPTRNIELLTEIRDLIKKKPKLLNMSHWSDIPLETVVFKDGKEIAKVSCGTTQCIAGWAVQLKGYKFLVGRDDLDYDDHYKPTTCTKNGRAVDIQRKAAELLGLTPEESYFLFLDVDNDEAVKVLGWFIKGWSFEKIQKKYEDL